jgi:hypothetical protein
MYMRDRYLATLLLLYADPARFGKLMMELDHAYIVGRNDYPKSLSTMYDLMVVYERH